MASVLRLRPSSQVPAEYRLDRDQDAEHPSEDIEIIGERNGIAYGQWKGGPAGTLHIEFDWRFAENLPAGVRARMDRAGKSWSHRILDDFGTHEVSAGTTIRHGEIRNDLDGT